LNATPGETARDPPLYPTDRLAADPRAARREATLTVIPHLTPDEIFDLMEFLNTLTGAPLPAALTRQPERP
jgi:hypothetical protein